MSKTVLVVYFVLTVCFANEWDDFFHKLGAQDQETRDRMSDALKLIGFEHDLDSSSSVTQGQSSSTSTLETTATTLHNKQSTTSDFGTPSSTVAPPGPPGENPTTGAPPATTEENPDGATCADKYSNCEEDNKKWCGRSKSMSQSCMFTCTEGRCDGKPVKFCMDTCFPEKCVELKKYCHQVGVNHCCEKTCGLCH